MITIVEQSTSDRKQETQELFNKVKPFLDEGYCYRESLIQVGRITRNSHLNARRGWFRSLIDYGAVFGYDYRK